MSSVLAFQIGDAFGNKYPNLFVPFFFCSGIRSAPQQIFGAYVNVRLAEEELHQVSEELPFLPASAMTCSRPYSWPYSRPYSQPYSRPYSGPILALFRPYFGIISTPQFLLWFSMYLSTLISL
jgi:hypothetical protein